MAAVSQRLFVVLFLSVFLGCDPSGESNSAEKFIFPPNTLVTVNGRPITQQLFDRYAVERLLQRADSFDASERDKILSEMINIELILQEAQQSGFAERPDVLTELQFQHHRVLTKMMLKQALASVDLSEEALKVEYQKTLNKPRKEYKARHILVASREKALMVIDQLKAGEQFARLAKEHSIGASGQQGGSLGWFNAQTMLTAFSEAVVQMQKSTFTLTPVHTRFGWHVILLEDVKTVAPGAFEALRAQLIQQIREKALNHYVSKLKQHARIMQF